MNFLMISLLVSTFCASAASKGCRVDGISDGPQALSCTLSDKSHLELSCLNGKYQLKHNQGKPQVIEVAYHLEVEEGNTPMVFRGPEGSLQVVRSPKGYEALFHTTPLALKGLCQ
jgi:hypothetical protein